jgi:hypothetical protein
MNNAEWDRRVYLQHIDGEHRRLNDSLRHAAQALHLRTATASEAKGAAVELVASLKQLRDELVQHFLEEARGGCMEEAACRCPSLTHEVSQIEAEHRHLLLQLEHLIDREQRGPQHAVTLDEFNRFAEQVEAYEAHEDHVMHRGFHLAAEG